jgi:hypothetical protein
VVASAAYCTDCARSALDAPDGSTALGSAAPRAERLAPRQGTDAQWIILVARDQPDLFAHLARAFARDGKVEVVIDRRKDYRRNPPGMEDRLRTHGAAVVRKVRR